MNGLLDDANVDNISGFGTADVYINGILVEDDVQDFYGVYVYGTNYTITDIKPISGHTYNANGGDNAPKEQDKPYGTNVNITEEKPERTGYTFAGWSQNPSAEIGEYKAGEKVPNLAVSGEVTLYAIWQPNEYKIKYITYDDDGNPVQMQAETFAKYGTGMITFAKIENERAGYDFKGWSTNKNATVPKYAK